MDFEALRDADGTKYVKHDKWSYQAQADTCVHYLRGDEAFLLLHNDGILITCSETSSIETIIVRPKIRFEMVELGEASYLLLRFDIQAWLGDRISRAFEETHPRGLLEKFGKMKSRPDSKFRQVGRTSTREKLISTYLTMISAHCWRCIFSRVKFESWSYHQTFLTNWPAVLTKLPPVNELGRYGLHITKWNTYSL